jgi:hypothetical protein
MTGFQNSPKGPPEGMKSPWLKSAPFDLLMLFGWLPFALWLSTTNIVLSPKDPGYRPAFDAALSFVLAVNFVHRHFVYFLLWGDRERRQLHARAVWLVPVVVVVAIVVASVVDGGLGVVAGVGGAWNIWHTLAQRHGVLRAYTAKAGGAAASRTVGRLDLALLLLGALLVAVLVMWLRQETFFGQALRVWKQMPAALHAPAVLQALAAAVTVVMTVVAAVRVHLTRDRPQLQKSIVWVSSALLLFTFVIYGPIFGYLCFGLAHAIEYIMFVYAHCESRLTRPDASWGIATLGRPLSLVAVTAAFIGLFVLVRPVWTAHLFVMYFLTTSLLHYIFDGMIWKRRPAQVQQPA